MLETLHQKIKDIKSKIMDYLQIDEKETISKTRKISIEVNSDWNFLFAFFEDKGTYNISVYEPYKDNQALIDKLREFSTCVEMIIMEFENEKS